MIGQVLSHYRIERRLGTGGMGEVYLAEDTKLGRKVALKILSSEMAVKAEYRSRFEREAKAVAALNHPNIVTIHSVENVSDPVLGELSFISMEYVEGRPLSALISEGGLDFEIMLDLAIPLADAVAAAHKAGITHRDLKPDNIMVTNEGRLKVLDFGLAKLRDISFGGSERSHVVDDCLTEEGKIVGTVSYMSPEQAEGIKVGPASDVFSLGVILYEMAIGRRPFSGESYISTILSIVKDKPERVGVINPALPVSLSNLIERCLSKHASGRFPSAVELSRELHTMRSDSVSSTAMMSVSGMRRRTFYGCLLGFIIVAAGLYAYLQWPKEAVTVMSDGRSIAVLPFTNLSDEPEQDYFSDGITEEISSKLARINNLEVVSTTSAARYKGRNSDAREIGSELGVRYLLEGSVRKVGKRVRITAQLVYTKNGFQLWSDVFEGNMDDVFGLQEETALHIAEALDLRLSEDEQKAVRHRYTANARAFDAYLRGRALIEYFSSPEKMEAAEQHFERALEYDPKYALALVGLSRVQAQYYRNLDPRAERLLRAENLAARALELDPRLAEAHLAMGQVVANQYRYPEAASLFRDAIRLEPRNAYAWDLLSWALAYQQPPDAEGAEEAARTSISLQASLIGAHYHLGRALVLQNKYDEAEAAFLQSKELDPTFEAADFGLSQVYIEQGEFRRALDVLEALVELKRAPVVPIQLAITHEALGDRQSALDDLEKAFELGYRDFKALEANELLDGVRQDSRYLELLNRFGM